jgi:hypothetical protein
MSDKVQISTLIALQSGVKIYSITCSFTNIFNSSLKTPEIAVLPSHEASSQISFPPSRFALRYYTLIRNSIQSLKLLEKMFTVLSPFPAFPCSFCEMSFAIDEVIIRILNPGEPALIK